MAAQRGFATLKSARIRVFRACKPFEDRKQALTNVPPAQKCETFQRQGLCRSRMRLADALARIHTHMRAVTACPAFVFKLSFC